MLVNQSRMLCMSCEITYIRLPVDVDVHKRDNTGFTQVVVFRSYLPFIVTSFFMQVAPRYI